jgi:hypothetical protein
LIPELCVNLVAVEPRRLSHTAAADPFPRLSQIGRETSVREKFDAASVARAAQLGRDPGWSAPLLPEHE